MSRCCMILLVIDPLHDDARHLNNPRRALREVSGVAGRLLTRKTMAEALVLFHEVYIRGHSSVT